MQSYVPLVALGAAGTLMDELTCAVPLLKCCPTGAQYAAICIRKWKALQYARCLFAGPAHCYT